MIGLTGAVRLMLATRHVDFRKGVDGLAVLVREAMGADPFSGTVYVFRSKRADRVKLVFWDGSGVVLVAKRLEAGEFRWPKIHDPPPISRFSRMLRGTVAVTRPALADSQTG